VILKKFNLGGACSEYQDESLLKEVALSATGFTNFFFLSFALCTKGESSVRDPEGRIQPDDF